MPVIAALVIRHLRKPGLAERLDHAWAEVARQFGLEFDHRRSRITGDVDETPIRLDRRTWSRKTNVYHQNIRNTVRSPETGITVELSEFFPTGLLLASDDDPESSPLHELKQVEQHEADNLLFSDHWTIEFEPLGTAETVAFDDNTLIQLCTALSEGNRLSIDNGSLDIGVPPVERPEMLKTQVETALRTAPLLNDASITMTFDPPNTPLPLAIDIRPLDLGPDSERVTTVASGAFFGNACPRQLEVMTRQDTSRTDSDGNNLQFDDLFTVHSVPGGETIDSVLSTTAREHLMELAALCYDVHLVDQDLVIFDNFTPQQLDNLTAWFDERLPKVEAIFRELNTGEVVFEASR